jgi:predicted nucleic acid-binding Zn ribbon protein
MEKEASREHMDSHKHTSRRTRTITQTIILVIIAVPFVFSFSAPQPYHFWFLNAGIFIIGILLVSGGVFFETPFSEAIGIQTQRSRRFYIITGIIFIIVAVTSVLINLRVL